MDRPPFSSSEPEEAAKFRNLDSPGLKELSCGCVCEVTQNSYIEIVRACPTMERAEVDSNRRLGPGDEVFDHIYAGIMARRDPYLG